MTRSRTALAALATLSVTALLGAAGCTSQSESSAASAGPAKEPAVMGAAAATTGAAAAIASAAAATSGAAAATAAAPAGNAPPEGRPAFQADPTAGRSIIYTATLNVQVPTSADVARQADAAADAASVAQGYVFARDGQAADTDPQGGTSVATADVTIKVPPAQYAGLLVTLGQLGKELSIQQTSQDVTAKVVDTKARLSAQGASVKRMEALLAKATTIGEVVEVEGQLTSRTADLESMEGELNVLKSQTAMATITLHLTSAPPKSAVPPPAKPKKHIHGFVGGLEAGGRGFATVAVGFATVLGAVLPFLATLFVLLLIGWIVWRQTRNRRQRQPEQLTS